MLKAFVGHHKLGHRMITVTKEDWGAVSQAYNVSGIPHVALIDRKGVIRMVRVGSGPDNAMALHDEIKKLIAEK
jgi:hypothetical protein